jgi:DoxX-like protein
VCGTSRAFPSYRDIVLALGYPLYFMVILGTWKVLGAVALVVPRRAFLKEWAYAGAFFVYTGAIVSHLVTGSNLGELAVLIPLTALTVLSWALRPASRRTANQALAGPAPAEGRGGDRTLTGRTVRREPVSRANVA